jgi:hypothetical protein
MDGTNGLKETTSVTAPVASNTLSVNVFTAPGKAMVGERPRPFGEALGFDPITSTLIFGEHDAVAYDCDLATDWFGSGSPEFGPIGAAPCAL